jgi:hypothetical protein
MNFAWLVTIQKIKGEILNAPRNTLKQVEPKEQSNMPGIQWLRTIGKYQFLCYPIPLLPMPQIKV